MPMSPSKKGAASIESFASVRRTAGALMKQRKLFSADLKNFTTRPNDARSKLLQTPARQGFYLITIVRTTLVAGKKFALPGCVAVIMFVPRPFITALVPTICKMLLFALV